MIVRQVDPQGHHLSGISAGLEQGSDCRAILAQSIEQFGEGIDPAVHCFRSQAGQDREFEGEQADLGAHPRHECVVFVTPLGLRKPARADGKSLSAEWLAER